MSMKCTTCDGEFATIPAGAVLLDDRNGIRIWRFPTGEAHVFHTRRHETAEVAEVAEQD
jgi:hypothetical protein